MIVAIHQPNFVPWLSFFDKMARADVLIILTHCQFEKNGFQNRFNNRGEWNTMSVNKGLDPLHTKRYVNHEADWDKITRRHPELSVFDDCISDNLCDTNIKIIEKAAKIFGAGARIRIERDYPTELTGTARLVDLCKRHGAKRYLSGPSGKNYLDLQQFESAGIDVSYHQCPDQLKKPFLDIL